MTWKLMLYSEIYNTQVFFLKGKFISFEKCPGLGFSVENKAANKMQNFATFFFPISQTFLRNFGTFCENERKQKLWGNFVGKKLNKRKFRQKLLNFFL